MSPRKCRVLIILCVQIASGSRLQSLSPVSVSQEVNWKFKLFWRYSLVGKIIQKQQFSLRLRGLLTEAGKTKTDTFDIQVNKIAVIKMNIVNVQTSSSLVILLSPAFKRMDCRLRDSIMVLNFSQVVFCSWVIPECARIFNRYTAVRSRSWGKKASSKIMLISIEEAA